MKFLKSMPKEKLQKFILVVLGGLIALGAVINFYVLRGFEELSMKGQLIAELHTKINDVEAEVKNEVSNTAARERMKTFVETQRQRMVTGDPFSWVVREMSLFAEKRPVHVGSISPGNKIPFPDKPLYSFYSTKLDLVGTYDQVGEFVRDLENNFPTGHIVTLGLSDADGGKGSCHAGIDFMLVMQPEEAAKPPAKAGKAPKKNT